jgi:uncharacterized iron-regulated membrane protein
MVDVVSMVVLFLAIVGIYLWIPRRWTREMRPRH